jgi:uroporphyrinogen decarboxylase
MQNLTKFRKLKNQLLNDRKAEMTSKQRIILMLNGESPDRLAFCPAIYEHKAKLIGKSVSEVATSSESLKQALLAEFEIYRPDMLTVGIDIYNIEAEALGCSIYHFDSPEAVPIIARRLPPMAVSAMRLKTINPDVDGRMPLTIGVAESMHKKLGHEVFVRGAITGPFSIACAILGVEDVLMCMLEEPDQLALLLKWCTRIALDYGCAFLKRGVQVCIFDSQSSIPLVSPQLYHDKILPYVTELISGLKHSGAAFVEYVTGGDNTLNVPNLIDVGADIILSDFDSDVNVFLQQTSNVRTLVRRNISPSLIEFGSNKEIQENVSEIKQLASGNNQLIVGTGVLAYNVPIENVLAVKAYCQGEL